MSQRLKIRLAYQRGWQVVDGSAIMETFHTKEAAFQFLVGRGARVHLDWSRTVIGGQTAACDFKATFQSGKAGRIRKELHGPSAGMWFWYQGSSSGSVATKEEAVFEVERAFTRWVANADWPR